MNNKKHKTARAPLSTLLNTALAIFAAEAIIMVALPYLAITDEATRTFIDAALLTLCASPLIYLLIIKPYIRISDIAKGQSDSLAKMNELLLQKHHVQDEILNSLAGVFYILDDRGRLIRWNRTFEEVSGYSTKELASMSALNFFDGDEKELVAERIKETFEQGESSVEADFVIKSGKRIPYHFTGRRLNIGGVPHLTGVGLDNTIHKLSEESMQLASLVFQNSSEAMLVTDADGTIISVNPSFTRLTGYTPDEAIGKTPRILKSGRQQMAFYQDMWRELIATGTWQGEIWNKRKNGEVYAERLSINTIFNKDGLAQRRVALFYDITEQKKSEELIWTQANFDQLTGLPNRSLFFDRLSKALSQARRHQKCVALLYLDLDGFKSVNDHHGHLSGDAVLKAVAQRWLACVREVDTVARMGGDEFAIILGDLDTSTAATAIAEKLLQALNQEITLFDGQECLIGSSIGISIYPNNGTEMDSLMAAADAAMYGSKAKGKNTYTYSNSLPTPQGESVDWIAFDDSHLIEITEIDEQHRKLVRLVNRVNRALTNSAGDETVKALLNELIQFTSLHFATEHRLMEQYRYPDLGGHDMEHERLVNEIQHLVAQLQQGNEFLILQSIKDWLLNHIAYSDKPLGVFLKRQGVN